ncbi:YchJ family protein [Kistimonas scapharcae]|uniref:UPF0225 protein GCM10023116_21660 n=1 Tax=Kistimonas scapharcae TaxID=1036133 RepID=A0ABP8V3L7_9GAMM
MTEQHICPCGTGAAYDDCCARFHRGEARPETAEQLMRSRYSAWALGLINYIIATTWPRQQRYLQHKALQDWADATEWRQLEIIDTDKGQVDNTAGEVEFRATYRLKANGKTDVHQERSSFIREEGQWFFIDPTSATGSNTGRNDPCPCGSGKKYKKCCMNK